MEEPEEINMRELMEYRGYRGRMGRLRLTLRFGAGKLISSLASMTPSPAMSCALHRLRGVKVGAHVYIGPPVMIDEVYPDLVTIEDYVSIGMRTMIYAHSNPTCSIELKQRFFPRTTGAVIIRKGAWIAPGCIILAGVEIGENAVVGAGSLVIKNVEPYTVVAGSPAKVIRVLPKQ